MQGETGATKYSGMEAMVIAIVVLAIGGTFGLYLLGLSGGFLGVGFIAFCIGLMLLAWPLFKRAHPSDDSIAQN
jgi:hypothetical protein